MGLEAHFTTCIWALIPVAQLVSETMPLLIANTNLPVYWGISEIRASSGGAAMAAVSAEMR